MSYALNQNDHPDVNDPYNATVIDSRRVSYYAILLRVLPDGGIPSYAAGSLAYLGLLPTEPAFEGTKPTGQGHSLIQRPYYISSMPDNEHYLEFYIYLTPSGELSPRLFERKPGERIFCRLSDNPSFPYESIPDIKDILMIATGTAITPFMGLLRHKLLQLPTRKILLLHGAKEIQDLGFYDELSLLGKMARHFYYFPVLRREQTPTSWRGLVGDLHEILSENTLEKRARCHIHPEKMHIFLAGHPDMVESCRKILADKGFLTADEMARQSLEPTLSVQQYPDMG